MLGKPFDRLELIPVFRPYLVAGQAVLLFLMDDHPAHLIYELVAFLTLHGDVSLVFIVIVHLLVGGHSV